MVDVVLCKTNSSNSNKAYVLKVREYNGIEVEWTTLCYMDSFSAHQLIGEEITMWSASDFEESVEATALRLKTPALQEAWDNYLTLKALVTNGS